MLSIVHGLVVMTEEDREHWGYLAKLPMPADMSVDSVATWYESLDLEALPMSSRMLLEAMFEDISARPKDLCAIISRYVEH